MPEPAPTLLIVGGRDQRVLELNREAQAMLRCGSQLAVVPGAAHLFEEPGNPACRCGPGHGLVPRAPTPMTPEALRNTFRSRVWTPAVKPAGIDFNVRIHDLRHAHASWLLAGGADLK